MPMLGTYDFKLSIKDFHAGIADNAFLLPKSSAVSLENVDIRSKVPDVGKKGGLGTGFTTGNRAMYCSFNKWQFGENGRGYRVTDGTEILNTTYDDIIGVERYNGLLVMFDDGGSSPKLHKLDYSDALTSNDFTAEGSYNGNWTPSGRTSLRQSNSNYGVSTQVFQKQLFFSNGDNVLILDTSNVVSLGLQCPSDIVGITVYGSRLKIFCDNGSILFWSGVPGTSWEEQIEVDEDIFMVLGSAGKDYVFSGENTLSDTYIYEMNGYSLGMIKDGERSGILSRPLATPQHAGFVKGGILHFPGAGSFEGIYTYGQALPGLPKGFDFGYDTASTSNGITSVYNIMNRLGVTYVSVRDSAGNTFTDVFSGVPTNASIVTQVYGDRVSEHIINGLEVRASDRVVVYYKYNQSDVRQYSRDFSGSGRTEWFDTDNHTFEEGVCRINGLDLDNLPTFRDIQFKIEFEGNFTSLDCYGQYEGE